MPRRSTANTKGRIISAAWKLFYENGYEDTTIEEIIRESKTSRGSFYHYFNGKDALLGTLAYVFDEKYEELKKDISPDSSVLDNLIYLNHALFLMIEDGISRDLLTRLLSTQLVAQGEKHLLDRNRQYFKLLKKIVHKGRENKEIGTALSDDEIVNAYAMWERALLYDWCLADGGYSLVAKSDKLTPIWLKSLLNG